MKKHRVKPIQPRRNPQPTELVSALLEFTPSSDLRASVTLHCAIGDAVSTYLAGKQGLALLQNIFTAMGGTIFKREDYVGDKAPTQGASS